MSKELLLEIGTEEIPSGFLQKAMRDMEEMAEAMFAESRLQHDAIKVMGTPRRLCLWVKALSEKQDDMVIEKMGPARKVAFDEQGNPTKAALGFARGQNVDFSEIETVTTDKGEYLCVRKTSMGIATRDLMPTMLVKFIASIPFRKSMRWSSYDFRFARPIHWVVALFGGEIVPFSIENITSGRTSYGHRFMSNLPFDITGVEDYLNKTREHFVFVDPTERREIILREIKRAAASVGGEALADPELLETVTFLVEYPNAVCGTFSPDYLKLPREVLITSMMTHQKYFPVFDKDNKLMANFVTVNNTLPRDPAVVRKGNEKVIRARLSDANFFFQEDQKIGLEQRVEGLKQVVFHTKLGTSFEKVTRFQALAAMLAEQINPDIKGDVDRVAWLAKADLDTQMVGEFSELQGIMGREYALLAGEKPVVAKAIFEHYLPIAAGGALPETDEGSIVSIADKMDTITGFFGVGLIPSGTADPYALRRQAIGIINIILNRNYKLKIDELIDWSLGILAVKLSRPTAEVKADVLEFFRGRFESQMIAQGYAYDIVDAVLATNDWNLVQCLQKIKAMETFKTDPVFIPFAVTFKRVENILKGFISVAVDAALFESAAESNLYQIFNDIHEKVQGYINSSDYAAALHELASLKTPVDHFFESVLVMAKDESIKNNRLSLLENISALFHKIADFSCISTEN